MKPIRPLIAVVVSLSLLTPPAYAIQTRQTASGETEEFLSNQVIIRYKPGVLTQSRAQLRASHAFSVMKSIEPLRTDVMRVPAGETVSSFIEKIKDHPAVDYVEPNYLVRAHLSVNDPLFSSQDYLQSALLNIEAVWDITTGASSVVVAVLDTGIDLTQPDLSANLYVDPNPNAANNEGTNGKAFLIDFNGDGDCDDTDISVGAEQCESANPDDDHTGLFHGTHAAGIIAAAADNGTEIAGIAHNARVMAVKVLNSSGAGSVAALAEGILYATSKGASVINMSLGSTANSATIESAVNVALANNVVVVAASGNTPSCRGGTSTTEGVNFPAALDRVIAVGATDSTNAIASFSCTGPEVDVVAPGVSILSNTSPSGTSSLNGTSFATPMVAAVAALIRTLSPTMTFDEVTQKITLNALDLGTTGFDNTFGFGRLNPLVTLQSVTGGGGVTSNPIDPGETYPYPNPFDLSKSNFVTINIPQGLGQDQLQITIFNLNGERVKTLTDTNKWNGRNDDGNLVASGLYFYFAQTSQGDVKGKLTLIK